MSLDGKCAGEGRAQLPLIDLLWRFPGGSHSAIQAAPCIVNSSSERLAQLAALESISVAASRGRIEDAPSLLTGASSEDRPPYWHLLGGGFGHVEDRPIVLLRGRESNHTTRGRPFPHSPLAPSCRTRHEK